MISITAWYLIFSCSVLFAYSVERVCQVCKSFGPITQFNATLTPATQFAHVFFYIRSKYEVQWKISSIPAAMAKHTKIEVRETVLRLSKKGKSSRDIANTLAIGKSTVNRIIAQYKSTNSLCHKNRSGRPRKTSERVDKIIRRKCVIDPRKTAARVSQELRIENLADISRSTVSRRLKVVGLIGRIGAKKPLISAKNKKARLDFAKKYQHWTASDWRKVFFSDESKFQLFGSDGRKYVRRPIGTRFDVRYQIPTMKHGGGNVKVWGAFSDNGVGPLVEINGNMDATMYRNILQEHMLPFARKNMPKGWIFQHDNDPKHSSRLVKNFLETKKVRLLDWPSQSPDLNPIEHLWQELKMHVGMKNHSNKSELWDHLQQEWEKLPQDRISQLIASMPRRCAAVIAAKGMATKY